MQPRDGGWPSRKGAAAADAMGTRAYFSMLSLPRSRAGLAETSKGALCSLAACLRNMLIVWLVLIPSSEKSFAASSLVCLSMRYGDVGRLHADLPASRVRNTAIVRMAGGMFPESVMA